jgi:glycosyltransferase involved in cell wall biosynthesis
VKSLVITHFFPPEPGAGATRVESLVKALVRAGHDVTVVTSFPSFPRGRFSESKRPFIHIDRKDGVRTMRLFSLLLPGVPGSRFMHWLTAALSASLYGLFTRERYDVVVISSPPITVAVPGLVAAWRHRAKLVVDVRDVFPDIAIQMGVWKANSFFARTIEKLVRLLYRRADLIVAVTPTAISQIAQRGVDPSRLVLARNAGERFPTLASGPEDRKGFTAIYAGNLGLTLDIDVLVDAAALVAADGITIEIVGDGAQMRRLRERILTENIGNVVVRGSVPRQQAMALVASADVSVIALRKGIEESIPTKLYDSLSVGCPVLMVAGGEAKREAESLGAMCAPSGDAEAVARALRHLALLDKVSLRQLGNSGRERMAERADRADIMSELTSRIGALA